MNMIYIIYLYFISFILFFNLSYCDNNDFFNIVNDNNDSNNNFDIQLSNRSGSSYCQLKTLAGGFSSSLLSPNNSIAGNVSTIIGKSFTANLINSYIDSDSFYVYLYSIQFNSAFNTDVSAVIWANLPNVYLKQVSPLGLIIEFKSASMPTDIYLRVFFAVKPVTS
jgi:hypothetical protein